MSNRIDYPTTQEKEQSIKMILNHVNLNEYKKNKRIKVRFLRPVYLTSFLIITISIFSFLYFTGSFNSKIQPYQIALMQQRVMTSQYLPNVNKMAVNSVENNPTNWNEPGYYIHLNEIDKTITLDNFNGIIETIGHIDNPFDREFTIKDVKDEVYFVLGQVPYFDQWVWIDGSGQGRYYVSYDEAKQHITIIRKSGGQPWIYDAKQNKAVMNDDFEGYPPNEPISEDVFYKIDYYYDELGREVVEAEIVSFLDYFENTKVTLYQYIKNIKDTSFTKYVIAPVTHVHTPMSDGGWGYDIDSNNPLGTNRQFIQIDYMNPDDVSLLFVTQRFSSAFNEEKNNSQVQFYRKINNDLFLYNTRYTYGSVENEQDIYHSFMSSNHYYKNVFDYYVYYNNFNFLSSGNAGTPDSNYKNRSSNRIEHLYRELFYSNGTDTIAIHPSEYYVKNVNDSDYALNKLAQIPLYLNVSLNQLAANSYTSESIIQEMMDLSPTYLDIFDYNKTFAYEHYIDKYLTKITEQIVNHSYLANKYQTKSSRNISSVEVEQKDQMSDLSHYIELKQMTNGANLNGKTLEINASATVDKGILLQPNGSYSLGFIAKDDSNNIVILDPGNVVRYQEKSMNLSLSTTIDLSQLNFKTTGQYQMGIALIYHVNGNLLVCSNLSIPVYSQVNDLNHYEIISTGYKMAYTFRYQDNQLKIIVTKTDIEAPRISLPGLNNDQTYLINNNSTVTDLIKDLEISDNDKIVDLMVINMNGERLYYLDQLNEEEYQIIVRDSSGNETILIINIAFKE